MSTSLSHWSPASPSKEIRMPNNSDNPGLTRELHEKGFRDLVEFARNAARRAQEQLERAQAINNAAEERQTRAAQKEDSAREETDAERMARMREDLDDKASTHRAINSLAKEAGYEAQRAKRATDEAEKRAGNPVEQEEMAKLRAEVEKAQAAAAGASDLADKTKLAADAAES